VPKKNTIFDDSDDEEDIKPAQITKSTPTAKPAQKEQPAEEAKPALIEQPAKAVQAVHVEKTLNEATPVIEAKLTQPIKKVTNPAKGLFGDDSSSDETFEIKPQPIDQIQAQPNSKQPTTKMPNNEQKLETDQLPTPPKNISTDIKDA